MLGRRIQKPETLLPCPQGFLGTLQWLMALSSQLPNNISEEWICGETLQGLACATVWGERPWLMGPLVVTLMVTQPHS